MNILSGTNKILAYNMGIFAEMFFELQHSFKNIDRMIMSGYGWGDEGINIRLGNWLKKENTVLIMLYEKHVELVEQSFLLSTSFERYVESGKIILIGSWFSDTSLISIEKYL